MLIIHHKQKDEIGRICLGVCYYIFGNEKFVPEYREFDDVVRAERWLLQTKSHLILCNLNMLVDDVKWLNDTDEARTLLARIKAALKWTGENIHDYSHVVKTLTKLNGILKLMLNNVDETDYHRALMMINLFNKFIFDEYETIKKRFS